MKFSEIQRLGNIAYIKSLGKMRSDWQGTCNTCGSTDIKEYQLKAHYYICAKCDKERNQLRYLRDGELIKRRSKLVNQEKTGDFTFRANRTIRGYKKQDANKFREICDFTTEEMVTVLKSECSYCKITDVTGVDRIDNKIGHIKSNCVPCCKECNIARNKNFSVDEMKEIGMAIRSVKLKRLI